MNRAQRRQAGKRQHNQRHAPLQALDTINTLLALRSQEPAQETDVGVLKFKLAETLARVATGAGSQRDLIELQQAVCMGFSLARYAWHNGDDAVKAEVAPCESVFTDASNHLADMCVRWRDTKRVGWTAEQRNALNLAAEWHDALLDSAGTRGELVAAIEGADILMRDGLAKARELKRKGAA